MMNSTRVLWALLLLTVPACTQMEQVRVSPDNAGFVLAASGRPFVPWGMNYIGPLGQKSWGPHWATIEKDFAEMKRMGVNVVRVHLEYGIFMDSPDKPNERSLKELGRLLALAERMEMYLDITGLGCYLKANTPAWYDAMSDADRWASQSRFWEAVAAVGASSPAIFCYDLMNEPISPGGKRNPGEWYGPELAEHRFIQWIALDQAGRPREEISLDWVRQLCAAIHRQDKEHMITVGLLPPVKGEYFFGFDPHNLVDDLDFISVHIYPGTGKVDESLADLKKFAVGRPVVVEETFPMACGKDDLREFILASRGIASGWIGHYNVLSRAELETLQRDKKITVAQFQLLSWYELFEELGPNITHGVTTAPASSSSAPK